MRDVESKVLTGQYRATSRDARSAAALRALVLEDEGGFEVADFEATLVPVGDVADAIRMSERWLGTTAFLTATNGQALLVARDIADHGRSVEVRRSTQQKVLAGWIARALADAPPGR
ncbi:hypothetical protein NKG05_11075 [Oerskovia sp. M15]